MLKTNHKLVKGNLSPKPFPIVGIGASAGGVKAFMTLLEHLNPNLGMAYVLIMHLSPNHKSALAEIMQSKTSMKVQTVKDGMEVCADNVYVIPPNTFMSLIDGHLKLAPRSTTSLGNFAVDYFFNALATIYKERAVGVILSGTATDGTLGLKAIKAEGGITFAQNETAEFNGMPNHAYESGHVHFRLSPENIAVELERLTKKPYTILPADKIDTVQFDALESSRSLVNQFPAQRAESNVEKVISKLILSQFVHPCVVINKNLLIIHFFGTTSPYLQPSTGRASLNVLKIIREDLLFDLGILIQKAKNTAKTASKAAIRISDSDTTKEVSIDVVPTRVSEEVFFLVVFKENTIMVPVSEVKGGKNPGANKNRKILRLEEELAESHSLLRTAKEEYETTFEELQANSEEILSANEELKSLNEELESSKEELQSAIEELTTTNVELRTKNIDLDRSQKSLKKVNEQLEQFAFISSHDLQEPLRKIQTFSDRLLDGQANLNEYARNYVKKVSASSARMAALIKDLLSFSVLSRSEKQSIGVDLNQIVKDVLNDFEITIEEKDAMVNVSTLPVVHAEPIQMNQLFHNLLSNSLKFSDARPEISISSRDSDKEDYLKHRELDRDRNYVAISFSDNGIGFDDRFIDKMFTLFQRLHDKKGIAGTGVGLTVCKKIVEDHGGFIYGHGEEGRGATFIIFLPR